MLRDQNFYIHAIQGLKNIGIMKRTWAVFTGIGQHNIRIFHGLQCIWRFYPICLSHVYNLQITELKYVNFVVS
ncbi:hypothetical protein D3C71_2157380 [compost metagenome]